VYFILPLSKKKKYEETKELDERKKEKKVKK